MSVIRSPFLLSCLATVRVSAFTFYVSPQGQDDATGTAQQPFATLARAQEAIRESKVRGKEPLIVQVAAGVYVLPKVLQFTSEDSGESNAPVIYRGAPNAEVVLSGARPLSLAWQPYRDGIVVADTPADFVTDQLFVNGQKQIRARYPNYDPTIAVFGGYAADATAPDRIRHWKNPTDGVIHALDEYRWGDFHFVITRKKDDGSLSYTGGWQTNRPAAMHPTYRYVENIFEELDAPGEWFHDRAAEKLYFKPPPGLALSHAKIEGVQLRELVEFHGSKAQPVKWIQLQGFAFRQTAMTYMETKEPLLRSDWKIFRGGAIFATGSEDCGLSDCRCEDLGGNAITVSGYNRRFAVRDSLIENCGASGVMFVGEPSAVRSPLFGYNDRQSFTQIDRKSGPQTDDYPMDCRVEDCLIRATGREEKQSAGVQISMARKIAVLHCTIYGVPRAGIDVSDGTWGGHLIAGCDVFDTVLESGDHGSFNAWGRDRYWHLEGALVAELRDLSRCDAIEPTVIRDSRWRCDHGWDIDLDDGSSNYEIYNNVLLRGGLKLREGFFRHASNNVIVNSTLYPHVWFEQSGDVFTHNIVMTRYRPAIMKVAHWGEVVDENLFTSNEADRKAFAAEGCDEHSGAGDAEFIGAAEGDFRVRESSPALRLGFQNFVMNDFGVRSPALRQLAKTPIIPPLQTAEEMSAEPVYAWNGAKIRGLQPGEFSAVGVAVDAGGVLIVGVERGSPADRFGLKAGDLIEKVNTFSIKTVRDLERRINQLEAVRAVQLTVRREQISRALSLAPPFGVVEKIP